MIGDPEIPEIMDEETAAHFRIWLERFVAPDDQATV